MISYSHFIHPVKPNPDYTKDHTYTLITSLEQLKSSLSYGIPVAWDTETTGLNPEESEVVGFSFTYNGRDAFYCPVKHQDLSLGKPALELFVESLKTSPISILYNARFDIRILEYSGFDLSFLYPKDPKTLSSKSRFIDVQNLVWLADTNLPLPSLKSSTLHFLGYQPPKFLETLSTFTNFSFVPAKDAYVYASLDAINTYNLCKVCYRFHKEAGIAGVLDQSNIFIIGQLEKTPIKMNTDYLISLRDQSYSHVLDLESQIYSMVGYQFKIGSNRELTRVFIENGIDTGERTKAGDMKTGIELLNLYLLSHPDCTLLKLLIEYKESFKFYNSYLKTLVNIAQDQENHPPRFSYKLQAVPCLTENNMVYVSGKGLVSIKEVGTGDFIWTAHGLKRVVWNHSHTSNNCVRVEFKNGSFIEGTWHHPVLVNKGSSQNLDVEWASIGDLKVGERVIVNHKPIEIITKGSIDREFARLLGFIDGDGCIAIKDRIKLSFFSEESDKMKSYYDNLMYKFFGLTPHIEYDKSKCENHLFFSTRSVQYLRDLGVRGSRVPECIRANPDVWCDYLAGLWDTDGNISFSGYSHKSRCRGVKVEENNEVKVFNNITEACSHYSVSESTTGFRLRNNPNYSNPDKKGRKWSWCNNLSPIQIQPQVRLKMTKESFMLDISNMLRLLSIDHSFYENNYYKNKANQNRQFTCSIKNHIGYVLFKNLIADLMVSNKRNFTDKYLNDIYREYADTKVKEVRTLEGNQVVYDIEVEDVHEYVANGIVTHNTGRLACGKDDKNTYFAPLNLQSIPKPKSIKCFGRKATQQEIENKEDILGWVFSPDHPEWSPGQVVEAMSPSMNVRLAFQPEHPENGDYVVSCDMCLESGSPVQTKRGYLGISELKVGDEVYSPKGWVKVIRVAQTGVKKLVKVYPDNGSQAIYCSEDHPFILNGEKVEAKYINSKLPSIELYDYRSRNLFVGESTPTSAYLFGFILCSGNIIRISEDTKRLVVWSEEESHLRLIGKIFGGDYEIRHKVTDQSEWWVLHLSQNDVCDRLISLGKSCGLTMSSNGIDFAWLGSNFRHFIRGMFDAVGSFSTEEEFSLELAGDVSYMSQVLNYLEGQWDYNQKARAYLNLQGAVSDKRFIYKYLYEGATIWLQRKRDRIEEWYKDNFGEIEMPVWDITVDSDDHLYYVNGVLTHNCGEELRIVTNLFREKSWADVINAGGDLHHANSDAIFGASNYTKETRKKAKGAAFGMLYGQEYRGFQQKFPEMTLEEAKEFMVKFKSTIPNITSGQKKMLSEAKRTGSFYTAFGRPRRVKYYLSSADYRDRAFGERTVKNSPIQGTAADVLKLEFIRLWDNLFTVYPEVKFICTIHDEINFSVPRSLVNKVIPIIIKCMTIKLPSWLVPLDCSLSCGLTLGDQIPFKYNFETKEFIPDWEEDKREIVEEKSVEKVAEEEEYQDSKMFEF